MPQEGNLQEVILDEAHNSAYSIHPGATNMYMELKGKYWWNGTKANIPKFVA